MDAAAIAGGPPHEQAASGRDWRRPSGPDSRPAAQAGGRRRTGPFTCRSTDIGVVLDLMIHDIDVTLSLIDEEPISVEALGAAVIGPNEDWAQARLVFEGGCVANLFASRVAWQAQRSMQVV